MSIPIIDPCMGTAGFLPVIAQAESLTAEQMVPVLMSALAQQRWTITELTEKNAALADAIEELTAERDALQVRLDRIKRKISDIREI